MDGFAVRSAETATASATQPVRLIVAGEIEAGDEWGAPVAELETVRVSTGAVVPATFDAVVPTEHTMRSGATINLVNPIARGRNIRLRGEDIEVGATAVAPGTALRAQEIGLLAALGIETVMVVPPPTVSIVSIGPELFPDAKPGPVFDANGPMLAAQVETAGGALARIECCDGKPEALIALLNDLAVESDLIITSGGISDSNVDSMADLFDAVPDAELWNVRLRPGKHLGFGPLDGCAILALPGNPVAALVTFELFGRVAIDRLMGRSALVTSAVALTEAPLTGNHGRTNALRGRARIDENGQLCVLPVGNRGSGVLSSLPDANCLILLPEDLDGVEPGELVSIRWVGYQ